MNRSEMGRINRDRGRRAEADLARFLRRWWPEAVRGYQARGGGAEAPDITGTPLRWECKLRAKHEAISLLERAEQEADAVNDGRPCLVAMRCHGSSRYAVVCWLDELPSIANLTQQTKQEDAQ